MKKVAYIEAKQAANSGTARTVVVTPLSERAQLSLHQQLMAQLDIEAIVERFYNWLNGLLPVSGVSFVHADAELSINRGQRANNSFHYVLRLQNTYLGEITITSRKQMSEDQMSQQEQAMGILSQYLNAALIHTSISKLAFRDSLTDTLNRTALEELLPREVLRAQRYGQKLSLAMIDMDKFKDINDTIGHLGGDQVLRTVAQAITKHLRRSDLAFRYGGDEFILLLPGTDISGARIVSEQILASLPTITIGDQEHSIKPKLSIGIAQYRQGDSAQELVARADAALYDAKHSGRNRICESA